MTTDGLAPALEAILFVADRPLGTAELAELAEITPRAAEDALEALASSLEGRGIRLQQLDGNWQLTTAPEVADRVRRYAERAEGRLSPAAMEALAIVAYQQPVTRGDIEDIRGVTVSGPIIKQLEERGWIEAIGTREAPGRPSLYATTRQFLDDLGLARLDQLPPLQGPTGAVPAPDLLARLGDGQGALELDAVIDGASESAAAGAAQADPSDRLSSSASTPQP